MNNIRIELVVGTDSIGLGANPSLEDRNRMTGFLDEIKLALAKGTNVQDIQVRLAEGLTTLRVDGLEALSDDFPASALSDTCWGIYSNVWKDGAWAQAQTL